MTADKPNTLRSEQQAASDTLSSVSKINSMPVIAEQVVEFGGPKGLEPTRYGDWERAGRCVDF